MQIELFVIIVTFVIIILGIYKFGKIVGKEISRQSNFYSSTDEEKLLIKISVLCIKEGTLSGAGMATVGFIYYCLVLMWAKTQPTNSHLTWLFIISIFIGIIMTQGVNIETKNLKVNSLMANYLRNPAISLNLIKSVAGWTGVWFSFSFGMIFSFLHFIYFYLKPSL